MSFCLKSKTKDWGGRMAQWVRALTLQAWGPKFDFLAFMERSWVQLCILSPQDCGADRRILKPCKPATSSEWKVSCSARDSILRQKDRVIEENFVLWPLCIQGRHLRCIFKHTSPPPNTHTLTLQIQVHEPATYILACAHTHTSHPILKTGDKRKLWHSVQNAPSLHNHKSSLPYHFVHGGCSLTNTKVLFSQSVVTVK